MLTMTWQRVLPSRSPAMLARVCAILGGRHDREHQRYLAGAFDAAELERRERAWERDETRNGSLLGRD